MVQPFNRESQRVQFACAAILRGVCGQFEAAAQDISMTGVRVRVARETLKLDKEARFGAAAACVQNRIGSRFFVDLVPDHGTSPVCRAVVLVRLVQTDGGDECLDLGCRFEVPLGPVEWKALKVDLPESVEQVVRQRACWDEGERPRIDPRVLNGTVEFLFDPPEEADGLGAPAGGAEGEASLRVVLHSAIHAGAEPLVCVAEDLSVTSVQLRISGAAVSEWMSGGCDAATAAQALAEQLGEWPEMEVVGGAQRLWRGAGRVYDVEVGEAPSHDLRVRLTLSRRLQPAELERLRT